MTDEGVEQVTACLQSMATADATVLVDQRPLYSAIKIAGDNYAASFAALTWFIFATAAVAFSAVFLARVTSRAKETGIRRAIGLSGKRAAAELMAESILISAAGAALATAAFLLSYRVFGISWGQDGFPLRRFALLVGLSTLLGPIGVVGPATVAARISPLSSIRDELGWGSQRRRLDLRQLYALVALGLAVGTVCFASSLSLSTVSGVDRQLRAFGVHDIEITSTPESSAPVGLEQYEKLVESVPSGTPVALVQRSVNSAWSPDGGAWSEVNLVGCDGDVDGALGFTCSVGTVDQIAVDEAALGSKLAETLGGKDALGKTILIGPEGKAYRVVGILDPRPKGVVDGSGDRNRAILLSGAGLSQVANPIESMARIVVRCADQKSADDIKVTAENALGPSYTAVKPFQALRQLRVLQVRFTGCIFFGSVALSFAVAVAVAIIMIIRMWEMRRSMAVQIAVGSTSNQVAAASATDVLNVTLAATGAGMAVGLVGYVTYVLLRKLPLQIGLGGALITASIGLLIAGLLGAVCFVFFRGKSVAQYLHD
jgi:ABC-type lipoprotein release transport system permease subunit